MLALVMDVSAACPCTLHTDYIVWGADLDAMEISDQNKSLTEQISFLQARLQKLQAMPCDSFATPAPSALRTPASAAPTAAGLKRGRGEESSSQRRGSCALGSWLRQNTSGAGPPWPAPPASSVRPAGPRPLMSSTKTRAPRGTSSGAGLAHLVVGGNLAPAKHE